MKYDRSLYNGAIKLAKANPITDVPPMAAIIHLTDGSWFSGLNKFKTHPLAAKFQRNSKSFYLHSEIDAIVNAIRSGKTYSDFQDSTLYVARVKRDGSTGLAKPCVGCQRAIAHFGITNVYFTEG